ncbi:TRM11 family SAM-dependent methyltransferase [Actinokineospora bangkokensis]|uniref:DNA modification methylase n=1 Tax=Actinokineospora bangkokensis TaxID=1193682 RepID=A0A1Q9LGV4_9PSEU|nr:SAM-dependent methyltransferase [Actinokineospora bangkokensis]OLR91277.1 DNA modification methylase [Actinokineospora bangkokensis]
MTEYVLLVQPAVNRVYAEASVALTTAELEVANRAVLGGRVAGIGETELAGVRYVGFTADGLDERDAAVLANLSSAFALFARRGDLLEPVALRPLDRFDDDLLTIQKYSGKTNEHFTKLLLNVAVWSSAAAGEALGRRLRVLDPVCGRGTTLNQALMYGWHAAGLDLDEKDFEAYAQFIQTWLKRKRLKHQAETTRIRREKRTIGRQLRATIGIDKDSYKAGDSLELTFVNGDTVHADEYFKAGSFDVVVGDAPYGVRHASRAGGPRELDRRPLDLIAASAPAWTRLLKPGGTVGLSWNTVVTPREQVLDALSRAGLEPLDDEVYRSFEHRVDQAITRDLVVARKPS